MRGRADVLLSAMWGAHLERPTFLSSVMSAKHSLFGGRGGLRVSTEEAVFELNLDC